MAAMKRITSRQNPLVAAFRAVGRGQQEGILLDGAHLVHEALAAAVTIRHAMVTNAGLERSEIKTLVERLARSGTAVAAVPEAVMAAASVVRSPSMLVALGERPMRAREQIYSGTPLVVVACDVQDPGNLGAIVRVAEAAGGTGVIAAGRSASPFGPKALRGSMGSALRLPVAAGDTMDAIGEAR